MPTFALHYRPLAAPRDAHSLSRNPGKMLQFPCHRKLSTTWPPAAGAIASSRRRAVPQPLQQLGTGMPVLGQAQAALGRTDGVARTVADDAVDPAGIEPAGRKQALQLLALRPG